MQANKNNKVKDTLIRYRLFFIATLVILLGGMLFKLGVLYSCQDGYLKGNICTQPKSVGTVQVCETDPYTCQNNCVDYGILDDREFCTQYCKTILTP